MEDSEQSKISPTEFMDKIGSLAGGVFILYLMVSFNFIPEIFGCQLQNTLKTNYVAKHLVGLMTVFFFINVTTTTLPWHLGIKFGFSLLLYVLFVLSNKAQYGAQAAFMMIIFVSYIMQLVRDQWKKYATDNSKLSAEEIESLNKKVTNLGKAQLGLFAFGIFLIVFGHLAYIGKKRLEYKTGFNYWELLKGSTGCSGTDRRFYTVPEALRSLFESKEKVSQRELERALNLSRLFEGQSDNLNLNVPSSFGWKAPSLDKIAQAGTKAGLTLSNLGSAAIRSRPEFSGPVEKIPFLGPDGAETEF